MSGSSKMHGGDNASNVSLNVVMNITGTIPQPLVSETVLWWIRLVVSGIICQFLALFGVTTNLINIIVFTKLGVKDSMNVSLIGLSFSDFGSCLAKVWDSICLFPPFMELKLPFQQWGAHYLFGAWPHVTFVKITIAITAFITIERCMCVTYPLKVKEIFTTKRVAIITASFYILNIIMVVPVYLVSGYAWVFSQERNRTLYTLIFTENREEVEPITFLVVGVITPTIAFIATVIATIILVRNLKKNAKWRQEATGASSTSSQPTSSGNKVTSRDNKVTKMVVMISTLYLISFSPVVISAFAMIIDPELKEGGLRQNMVHVLFDFNFLLETNNAALNIFIYYYMSSNYKSMFRTMFKMNTGHGKISN